MLSLVLAQFLLMVAGAGFVVASVAITRERIATVADLAALAAAEAADAPCLAAASTAESNGLSLAGCVRDGPDVIVTIRAAMQGPAGSLLALLGRADGSVDVSARAGFP
jgi:secretion/DNA translocation related TadE-like protein